MKKILDSFAIKYHIGKQSLGWQFMFESCSGPFHWDFNLNSIKQVLSRSNIQIIDEYGKEYSYKEFFEKISPGLYNDPEKYMNRL